MRLRPVAVRRLLSLLGKLGYSELRQKGAHLILGNAEGKLVVIPIHSREIGIGLLREIIRELGMTRGEFLKKLEQM